MMRNKRARCLAAIIAVIVVVITLMSGCDLLNKNKETAESYVKASAYRDSGLVADHFKTTEVYKSGSKTLMAVKFASDNYDWLGSYCVYLDDGIVRGCTSMMHPDYNYTQNIAELKALFGLL
ncbi:MAG: hypothetical protein IKS19_08445 [Clostridia bacterium]|nr:hypothetical protein [Clostridia bacterium]